MDGQKEKGGEKVQEETEGWRQREREREEGMARRKGKKKRKEEDRINGREKGE